ncbi:hypothetical protein T10_6334 [Trichinella papuae]|uniref:Uncharacterized protein n=1 Tax=Trichinella papuae TaxID=268474 RepID=A0A0V1MM98_9BILA|nr:hypothetical protein T10_6334 [Trichinella papuae]
METGLGVVVGVLFSAFTFKWTKGDRALWSSVRLIGSIFLLPFISHSLPCPLDDDPLEELTPLYTVGRCLIVGRVELWRLFVYKSRCRQSDAAN